MPAAAWGLHGEQASASGVWGGVRVFPELARRTAFLSTHEMQQRGNHLGAHGPEQQVRGPGARGPGSAPL